MCKIICVICSYILGKKIDNTHKYEYTICWPCLNDRKKLQQVRVALLSFKLLVLLL